MKEIIIPSPEGIANVEAYLNEYMRKYKKIGMNVTNIECTEKGNLKITFGWDFEEKNNIIKVYSKKKYANDDQYLEYYIRGNLYSKGQIEIINRIEYGKFVILLIKITKDNLV